MFDDQPTNDPVPPSNLPVEADDMFKEVEEAPVPEKPNALESGLLKPKAPTSRPVNPPSNPIEDSLVVAPSVEMMGAGNSTAPVSNPILGKIFLTLLILVILGAGGFGGWWLYKNVLGKQPPATTSTGSQNNNGNPEQVPPSITTSSGSSTETTNVLPTSSVETTPVDTDNDGLTDDQERAIGTDARVPDTDGDGLTDGDEVVLWHTNPQSPDTDNDGYTDGVEVKNGYNPNGAGKLQDAQVTTGPSVPPTTSVSTTTKVDIKPATTSNQNTPTTSSPLPPIIL